MKKTKTTKRTEPAAVNQSAWPEISKERDRELRRIAELKVRATDEDFDPVLHELGQAITAGTATAKDRDKFTRLLNARWKKPTTTYVAELNSEFEAERVQRHVAVIIGNRNAEAARKIAAERDRMAAVNMDSVLSAISGKNVPVYQATPKRKTPWTVEEIDRLSKDRRQPWMNVLLAFSRASGNEGERWLAVAYRIQTCLMEIPKQRQLNPRAQPVCEYLTRAQVDEWLEKMRSTSSIQFTRQLASALRRNLQRKPAIIPKASR
ncbi:MAG: hypothetical protein EOL90_00270 [Spartobacteria bacterium]|nr:hypothetical protein [Spartobacteria bacterium]